MKIPLILTVFTYLGYRLLIYLTGAYFLSLLLFIIPVALLVTNLLLRKKLKYRNWFLNKTNLLNDKMIRNSNSNISSELLFEKLKEVIQESNFKLLETDSNSLMILASTSPNFWTWGENIYINILPDTENSKITLTSVTIFGSYAWSRNKSNHEQFYHSFEESLTI
ncbi:MAG: hypothetical protein ACI9N1_001997 [Flavobacteriales bacterium]|jgi:hypothetical protein